MQLRTLSGLALALTLVAGTGACGDDSNGSAADAGEDIDPPDAGPPTSGTCGILVDPRFRGGGGVVTGKSVLDGHTVVFSNPDGSLIGTATTDATGAASRDDCVRNTIITAVIPRSLRYFYFQGGDVVHSPFADIASLFGGNFALTYTHVQPEEIVYYGGGPTPDFSIKPSIPMNVTVPGVADYPDADVVIISNGCQRSTRALPPSSQCAALMTSGSSGTANNAYLQNGFLYAGEVISLTLSNPQNDPIIDVHFGTGSFLDNPVVASFVAAELPVTVEIPVTQTGTYTYGYRDRNGVGSGATVDFVFSCQVVPAPQTYALTVTDVCSGEGAMVHVYALLIDEGGPNGDVMLASSYLRDVSVASDGSTVAVLPEWTPDDTSSAVTAGLWPPGTTQGLIESRHQIGSASYAERSRGGLAGISLSTSYFGTPRGLGARVHASATAFNMARARTQMRELSDYRNNNYFGMDAALPFIREVVITGTPDRPELIWQTASPLTEGDLTVIELDLNPTEIGKTVEDPGDPEWLIVTPRATEGGIRAPALTAETLAALVPPGFIAEPVVQGITIFASPGASYNEIVTKEGFQPEDYKGEEPTTGALRTKQTSLGSFGLAVF